MRSESHHLMKEKAHLIITASVNGQAMAYECSQCGRAFFLLEDRTAKEAMAKLWAEFKDHVRVSHPDDHTSS